MGLLDKIKDLFTDEEIIEEPIKKEVIRVEIPSPKKMEIEKNEITDSNIIKNDEKISKPTPIFFNDKDFEDLKEKKEVKTAKSSYMIKKNNNEPKKQPFKPSPIISPVYGILDQNYTKDDIVSNKNKDRYKKEKNLEITFDDIRKKAYGTLEEELEQEMFGRNSILFNEEIIEETEEEIDLFEELNNVSEEIRINGVELTDDNEEEVDEMGVLFESSDKLNENDLFNLIDSMYEKGDD